MQKVVNALTSDFRNEPLAHFYKAYRRENGLGRTKPAASESRLRKSEDSGWEPQSKEMVKWEQSSITVGPATFNFNRTLRVPDDAVNYALPPVRSVEDDPCLSLMSVKGLGTFPIVEAQKYAATAPEYIQRRGGYIMVSYFSALGPASKMIVIAFVSTRSDVDGHQSQYAYLRGLHTLNCSSPSQVRFALSRSLWEVRPIFHSLYQNRLSS